MVTVSHNEPAPHSNTVLFIDDVATTETMHGFKVFIIICNQGEPSYMDPFCLQFLLSLN